MAPAGGRCGAIIDRENFARGGGLRSAQTAQDRLNRNFVSLETGFGHSCLPDRDMNSNNF
jgi:hypothetical protein